MIVKNEQDNLMYDESNPLCSIQICASQGDIFAFVVALDIGLPHCRLSKPGQKRYWGKYNWNDKAGSIKQILADGGQWPTLSVGVVAS